MAEQISAAKRASPSHYREITRLMLESGRWRTDLQNTRSHRQFGNHRRHCSETHEDSLFVREQRGVYGLTEWRDDTQQSP